jgi:hypothetical protein
MIENHMNAAGDGYTRALSQDLQHSWKERPAPRCARPPAREIGRWGQTIRRNPAQDGPGGKYAFAKRGSCPALALCLKITLDPKITLGPIFLNPPTLRP